MSIKTPLEDSSPKLQLIPEISVEPNIVEVDEHTINYAYIVSLINAIKNRELKTADSLLTKHPFDKLTLFRAYSLLSEIKDKNSECIDLLKKVIKKIEDLKDAIL